MAKENPMPREERGRLGGTATKERHGTAHYSRIGHLGGDTTSERYGEDFYQQIGRKGGGKVRALVAAGKLMLEAMEKANGL